MKKNRIVELRPDGVTAIVASRGVLKGNARYHERSANVVSGFESPEDSVTWTVIAPKEDDYVINVLFSKKDQVQLEIATEDSIVTFPSMTRAWKKRPFFWRQKLPKTLRLKAGENKITFRVPEVKPIVKSEDVKNSTRFGHGVTKELHLFSIELGTAATRKAEIKRAKELKSDISWMEEGKYGIFVHWSSLSHAYMG